VKAAEIRQRFLEFFEKHGHTMVPSAPLIPRNDPSLYFVNAGMVQFKDTFIGAEPRDYDRATSVQKCLRVSGKHNDLDNVGRTPRHHTLFEMMGNFSFGAYFKKEAIALAWEFLTKEMALDVDRLWVTVFEDDDEAYQMWLDIGFPEERLQRLGAKENFWSMGDTGPCGPCTEIHYDHGAGVSSDTRGPAGEDDRYVEIWNLVFMQYEQAADGTRSDLPRPSIDTGMGLERLAAIKQGVFSNYDTDIFQRLINRAADLAGVTYGDSDEVDTSLRVIADHARATAFLIGDGVMPSNTERGYVLRRIMRRAIRFGVKINLDKPFFHHITDEVIADFSAAYPDLAGRGDFIREVVLAEEERFRATLDRGMRLLGQELAKLGSGEKLSGDVAFRLSDTFGFPLDLTQLIAEEHGIGVDVAGFQKALGVQKAMGRANWKGSGEQAVSVLWHDLATAKGETEFTGYDTTEGEGQVIALVRQTTEGEETTSESVDLLAPGESGIIVLDRTPFYGESGGQVGDSGALSSSGVKLAVSDTNKASGLHLHHVADLAASVKVGQTLGAHVSSESRDETKRNHTATHLLHAALRKLLGDHVTQKGSLVGPRRLRFDFSHHKPVTQNELHALEDMVNREILRNTHAEVRLTTLDQAKAEGAMALFGEKYDNDVRVVEIPGFSVELCGGTHVDATGDIGMFVITSESGVAAGVRRIEAQTGFGALAWSRDQRNTLQKAAGALKVSTDKLDSGIQRLKDERKSLEKEVSSLKGELAKRDAANILDSAVDVRGVKVLAARMDGDLREQADRLRDKLGTSIIVLASERKGKAVLLAAASKDIAGKRIKAGDVIKALAPMVGGRGGGRPDLAQAGGKDPSGIDQALQSAVGIVTELLG